MSNNNLHSHKLAKNKCEVSDVNSHISLERGVEELHLTCGSARSCGAGAGDGGGALLVVVAATAAQSGGVPRHGPLLRAPRPTVLFKQTNKQKNTRGKIRKILQRSKSARIKKILFCFEFLFCMSAHRRPASNARLCLV